MESLNLPGIGPAVERRVAAVDAETLTPIVRRVLDDVTAAVTDWRRVQMRGGSGGGHFGTALFRFAGTAATRTGVREWSVVLKVLAERPGETPAGHPYWKREAEAYRSDLLEDARGRLVPAELYRVDEFDGEAVWLWLEDLTDEYGGDWPLEQYRRAARHLGQFDGAFVGETDRIDEPWVTERTFEFETTAGVVALVDRVPDDPIVSQHFPTSDDRQRLFAAWRDRERFLDARANLPRTFCHFDAFGRNLFATTTADGTPQTVAIDWDQCGMARVGDDAGALVLLTLLFVDWPVTRADELERAVLDGYRAGLADAGWDGPDAVVTRGYRLHLVNRWLEWLGAIRVSLDDGLHDWIADVVGEPFEDVLAANRDVHRFVLDAVDDVDLAESPSAGRS
ncbi:aminoglycoside phosphotransferase family protein [Halomicroarcula sp. S1AR25-4]|uniref:hypothetical protein n=1 Tax=Haloarcula sp. S1AR25-4 TaxID=2950538 RepID=UPI0028743585|nr:hypothetical protein [Halomicroarcula sp. S1AR25-4]MDS0278535.1 aminoglycoside phosphotransferase family protein [Halomicroarcula sp. S1AR25-4]